jgi:hypothetical protein
MNSVNGGYEVVVEVVDGLERLIQLLRCCRDSKGMIKEASFDAGSGVAACSS